MHCRAKRSNHTYPKPRYSYMWQSLFWQKLDRLGQVMFELSTQRDGSKPGKSIAAEGNKSTRGTRPNEIRLDTKFLNRIVIILSKMT